MNIGDHTPYEGHNRRGYPRLKAKVPIELRTEGSDLPMRGAVSDLSLTGCYVETMFPLPIGTVVEISLQVSSTLLAVAKVVTSDPQVGNGIRFTKMLPEDQEELQSYIKAALEAE
jgi:c-di-GMP-binding flagellar brake protein YcgR